MDLQLRGCVALVTGGSRGTGRAIAGPRRTPEEVADAVCWINGASIPVDGAQGRPGAF